MKIPHPMGAISTYKEMYDLCGKSIFFVIPTSLVKHEIRCGLPTLARLHLHRIDKGRDFTWNVIVKEEDFGGCVPNGIGTNEDFLVPWGAHIGFFFKNYWYALAYAVQHKSEGKAKP